MNFHSKGFQVQSNFKLYTWTYLIFYVKKHRVNETKRRIVINHWCRLDCKVYFMIQSSWMNTSIYLYLFTLCIKKIKLRISNLRFSRYIYSRIENTSQIKGWNSYHLKQSSELRQCYDMMSPPLSIYKVFANVSKYFTSYLSYALRQRLYVWQNFQKSNYTYTHHAYVLINQ